MMNSFPARLTGHEERAGGSVHIVRVVPPDPQAAFPRHLPGQYARIEWGDGCAPRPYSIASHPDEAHLEFHIRMDRNAFSHVRKNDEIIIHGYGGECLFQSACSRPALLIAGGTGLAPMLSIARASLKENRHRPVTLYHGVQQEQDLYADDILKDLAQKHMSFEYLPVIGMPVGEIALQKEHVEQNRIYAAGPFQMLRHVHDLALTKDLSPDLVHSDLHEFEARQRDGK